MDLPPAAKLTRFLYLSRFASFYTAKKKPFTTTEIEEMLSFTILTSYVPSIPAGGNSSAPPPAAQLLEANWALATIKKVNLILFNYYIN